jgi:hypothetical protein
VFTLAGPAARAYLDAFTGSFLFQLIAGGLVTFAVGLKLFGRAIWRALSLRFGRGSDDPGGSEESSPDVERLARR